MVASLKLSPAGNNHESATPLFYSCLSRNPLQYWKTFLSSQRILSQETKPVRNVGGRGYISKNKLRWDAHVRRASIHLPSLQMYRQWVYKSAEHRSPHRCSRLWPSCVLAQFRWQCDHEIHSRRCCSSWHWGWEWWSCHPSWKVTLRVAAPDTTIDWNTSSVYYF